MTCAVIPTHCLPAADRVSLSFLSRALLVWRFRMTDTRSDSGSASQTPVVQLTQEQLQSVVQAAAKSAVEQALNRRLPPDAREQPGPGMN